MVSRYCGGGGRGEGGEGSSVDGGGFLGIVEVEGNAIECCELSDEEPAVGGRRMCAFDAVASMVRVGIFRDAADDEVC